MSPKFAIFYTIDGTDQTRRYFMTFTTLGSALAEVERIQERLAFIVCADVWIQAMSESGEPIGEPIRQDIDELEEEDA